MAYNEKTNYANERKYLNNLISGGGGNAEWAKNQMKALNSAEQKYGNSGGSSGGGSSGGRSGSVGGGYTQKTGKAYYYDTESPTQTGWVREDGSAPNLNYKDTTPYAKGTKGSSSGADLSRDMRWAGKTVQKNGYAITYDENGYAVSAINVRSGAAREDLANVYPRVDADGELIYPTYADGTRGSGYAGTSSGGSGGGSGGGSSGGGSTDIIGYSPGGGEYPVGSERGIGFVKNATAGSKIIGSDGSVWLKNKDGSTTITKNGQTYTIGAQGNGASEGLEALRRELQQLYGEQGSYAQALAAQQEANRANVQKAVGSLQDQKRDTETSYANMFRQLYLNKMKSQKNIGQQLAAQGKTGGAAESTMLGLDTSYSDALRQGEQGRIGALGDLDRAITDAELTGDIANAELAAANAKERTDSYADVLRDLMDRYDQQNAQNTAYEREDADNARAYAYKTAMQLLQSGSMASDELLESAGISKADAQAMVAAVAAQKAAAVAAQKATAKSSGRTTTPSKTRAAVSREILLSNGYDEDAWRDLEAYYGLTRDRIAQADPELAAALQMNGRTAPSEAEQLAARDKNFATWLNEANRLAEGGTSVQRLAEILQSWIALGRITQEQGNMIAATFGY